MQTYQRAQQETEGDRVERICGDTGQDIRFSENMDCKQSYGRNSDNTKHQRSSRSGKIIYHRRGLRQSSTRATHAF